MSATTDSQVYDDLVARNPDFKKILAEGDSWFAYPRKYLSFGKDANIIDHLAEESGLIIYNTSSNGDEAVSMLSGESKLSFLKKLSHNYFDYLLFSGGGNDIVGRFDFDFFIQENTGNLIWQECIHKERVELKISQIKATYEILCELTREYSKNEKIKIITHTYDYIQPRAEGYELFDLIPLGKAWIYPYLAKKKILDPDAQKNIVNYLLGKFKTAVQEVSIKYNYFIVVDTQGTVRSNEWRNEIHPSSSGFGKIAKKIYLEGLTAEH